MNATVKILAINDEQTVCDCCGKTNLKRTVVLELENGEIVRYGTDCAAKMFKGQKAQFKSNSDVYTFVQKWLGFDSRYTPEATANCVWNRFGYQTKVEAGSIYIYQNQNWTRVS